MSLHDVILGNRKLGMDSTPKVWQISGGPPNRPFADIFIQHGVALIGPGDAGPWRPDRPTGDFNASYVSRFAAEMQPGDILLLRTGVAAISAIGLVASDYLYLPQFDDVNGFDLQHARRVRWFRLPDVYPFDAQVFGAVPLSQVTRPDLVDYAQRFIQSPPTHWQSAPLPPLPAGEPELPVTDLPQPLVNLVAQAHDLVSLYWDRNSFGDHPAEDEVIVHFVAPLLRALGWPVECIAVKWQYVDVAVFRQLPRTRATCHVIIEAKRLGQGVEGALEQARGYVQALGLTTDIVVTDGIRYRLYARDRDFTPVAYANLTRLKPSALSLFERMSKP